MTNVVDTKAQFNFVDKKDVANFATLATVLGADLKITKHAESKSSIVEMEWEDRDVLHQIVALIAAVGLQKQRSIETIVREVTGLASKYGFAPDAVVNPANALANQDDAIGA